MAEEEPKVAIVLAIAGKYHILDLGAEDQVQVDDIFDAYETVFLKDPEDESRKFNGYMESGGHKSWARAVTAELQVEQVFADHCYAVLRFSSQIPAFEVGDTVEHLPGHNYRITATGTTQGRKP